MNYSATCNFGTAEEIHLFSAAQAVMTLNIINTQCKLSMDLRALISRTVIFFRIIHPFGVARPSGMEIILRVFWSGKFHTGGLTATGLDYYELPRAFFFED